MIKKGIILAGGKGTRLSPLTKVSNKQLLPVYDKPLIYYPLSVLLLAKIRDILIITNPLEDCNFKKILGDGSDFGVKISYQIQNKPYGLPHAFILAENFIKKNNVALILGDNIFYGQGFSKRLQKISNFRSGATIFTYPVNNPSDYGIIEVKKSQIKRITEKPKNPKSNLSISGLYFFDKYVSHYSKKLKPSNRKELEIVDLLKIYKNKKKLKYLPLGRGSAWLDTGNINNLFEATQFISSIEKRQGLKIACLEEIAYSNNWITKSNLKKRINFYGDCEYSNYLKKFL